MCLLNFPLMSAGYSHTRCKIQNYDKFITDGSEIIMKSPLYLLHDSPRVNRRSFLIATSSLAAAAMWSTRAFGAITKLPAFSDYPFQLGVASGDPASDGFVLWTRLAPKPLEGGGMKPE